MNSPLLWYGIVVVYVLFSCAHMVISSLRKDTTTAFDPLSVLVLSEMIKLFICSAICYFHSKPPVRLVVTTAPLMAIPASVYFVQNFVYFQALGLVSAPVYIVLVQSRHVITAILTVIFLHRVISSLQWRALALLTLGAALVQLPEYGQSSFAVTSYVGPAFILLQVTLASFAGIYFEKIVKTRREEVDIWTRNVQMSAVTLMIALCANLTFKSVFLDIFALPIHGVVLSISGGIVGLLVALLVFYSDNIVKNMIGAATVVLTTVVDNFLKGTWPGMNFVLGSVICLVSISMYQDFGRQPVPSEETSGGKEMGERGTVYQECVEGDAPGDFIPDGIDLYEVSEDIGGACNEELRTLLRSNQMGAA